MRKLNQATPEKHFYTSILSNLPPRPIIFFFLPLIACLLGSPAISFADFSGCVVGVTDGDTIKVLHSGHAEKIRLSGIDCPEKRQAYGKRAKQAASELVFGKDVTLQTFGKDKYVRTIADVLLPDGTNVNYVLVRDGCCWWYQRYALRNTVLEGIEREAREGRKGLWADPHPVSPWEWRRRRD